MVKGTRLAMLPRLLFPRIHLSESVIFRDSDNGLYYYRNDLHFIICLLRADQGRGGVHGGPAGAGGRGGDGLRQAAAADRG